MTLALHRQMMARKGARWAGRGYDLVIAGAGSDVNVP
jgi:hypothetical protein